MTQDKRIPRRNDNRRLSNDKERTSNVSRLWVWGKCLYMWSAVGGEGDQLWCHVNKSAAHRGLVGCLNTAIQHSHQYSPLLTLNFTNILIHGKSNTQITHVQSIMRLDCHLNIVKIWRVLRWHKQVNRQTTEPSHTATRCHHQPYQCHQRLMSGFYTLLGCFWSAVSSSGQRVN